MKLVVCKGVEGRQTERGSEGGKSKKRRVDVQHQERVKDLHYNVGMLVLGGVYPGYTDVSLQALSFPSPLPPSHPRFAFISLCSPASRAFANSSLIRRRYHTCLCHTKRSTHLQIWTSQPMMSASLVGLTSTIPCNFFYLFHYSFLPISLSPSSPSPSPLSTSPSPPLSPSLSPLSPSPVSSNRG